MTINDGNTLTRMAGATVTLASVLSTNVYAEPLMLSYLDMSIEELLTVQVSTTSRREESISKAPATLRVITREQIQARGYTILPDLLKDLPGINLTEFAFSEWGSDVTVRGVTGNNKIILLIDGTRVNPPGGENLPIRSDISLRNAKQVEINYGPSSTLYGQDV